MPRGLKKGVLELTKLEYPKKWYFPTYFANSVFGPNISKFDANGPFWPTFFPLNLSNFKRSNAKRGRAGETMFWTLDLSM